MSVQNVKVLKIPGCAYIVETLAVVATSMAMLSNMHKIMKTTTYAWTVKVMLSTGERFFQNYFLSGLLFAN